WFLLSLRVVSGSIEQTKKLEKFPQMDIDGKDIKPTTFDISFDNVEFSYSGKKILDDISVKIPQNQMTAIVGPSGAGKEIIIVITVFKNESSPLI
ncbi:Multidrug ABC transporter, partial [human gut metagenome]